ncbi:myosin light chain kinase, smooth muscle isoform X1 [Polypterus senegalus]|uniref:myosin light chain kinase, smooth muscle isoform X1 n=1 Tax=Polypterus senegalus TaxID=55291 RepID=UPI001965E45E|nr:myosin light chain kinase, smooth muscle isoform X1 [Polypterus senegalus]
MSHLRGTWKSTLGKEPPFFLLPPRNAAIYKGETAMFLAKVKGQPDPEVGWHKGDRVLTEGGRLHFEKVGQGTHIFTIQKVTAEDAGKFRCELRNSAGTQQITFRLELKEAADRSRVCHPVRRVQSWNESRPRIITRLRCQTVCRGEMAVFRVRASGRPPPKATWFKNSRTLEGSTRIRLSAMDGVFLLEIEVVQKEDEGTYICELRNVAGRIESTAWLQVMGGSPSVTSGLDSDDRGIVLKGKSSAPPKQQAGNRGLDGVTGVSNAVLRAPRPEPPSFRLPLVDCSVDEGCDIVLEAALQGSSPIHTSWLHNGEPVQFGKVSFHSGVARLVVRECLPEDAGAYTCMAENGAGKCSSSAAVSVRDFESLSRKPSIPNTPASVPTSSLRPKASSQSIVLENKTTIRAAPSISERPQPPAGRPHISQTRSGALTLSWSGPCYDGGSAVTSYVVEMHQEGANNTETWNVLTATCLSTSYRLPAGLHPQGKCRFRVRATNVAGVSEPSLETELISMDSVEENGTEEPPQYTDVSINSTQNMSDAYEQLEKLGVGKFGNVYKLRHKTTGHICAGKFYKARLSKEKAAARREIELMNSLHHPKLVQCLAAFESRSEIVMVMEYIAGGELFERIVDDAYEHTETTSICYIRQILEGLRYMHHKNIIHLDLKPENVVCTSSTGTLIKIIDFGLASRLDPKTPLKVMHGTPEFVAPEVIAFDPVGLSTDMWSVGVICYILLSGVSPFQGSSDTETLALVTAAQWQFDEDTFREISDQAKDFISSLLKKDMRHRLSSEQALAHPWMDAQWTVDSQGMKSLSKERMKKFLARQKWRKTGKALLALKRMTLLSNKQDATPSPTSVPEKEEPTLSPEEKLAFGSLETVLHCVPHFIEPLQDITATEGSEAHFQCRVQANPAPQVSWLLDGRPVTESAHSRVAHEDQGGFSLQLSSVSAQDSGLYSCKATNSQGEALSSARLSVIPAKR